MSTDSRYLTVTEVATILHYSGRHVRRLIAAGEIRAWTPGAGRRMLIREDEVESFLRPAWVVKAEQEAAA